MDHFRQLLSMEDGEDKLKNYKDPFTAKKPNRKKDFRQTLYISTTRVYTRLSVYTII